MTSVDIKTDLFSGDRNGGHHEEDTLPHAGTGVSPHGSTRVSPHGSTKVIAAWEYEGLPTREQNSVSTAEWTILFIAREFKGHFSVSL